MQAKLKRAAVARGRQSGVDVFVRETAGTSDRRPVTGGVPVAEGAAPRGARFVLLDKRNKPVPCQTAVLATWKDGSARWVLLDFQAGPRANRTERFRLISGRGRGKVRPSVPVRTARGKSLFVESGIVKLSPVQGAVLRVSGRFDVKLVLIDRLGRRCEAVVESSVLEARGMMRSTLALAGSFRAPGGKRIVDFRLRASLYAGLTRFYLEPQILVNADKGAITYIKELNLEFVPLRALRSARIGGSPGWKGSPESDSSVRLFQTDDRNYRIEGAAGSGGKAPGWIEADDGQSRFAICLRHFWQQWPKSIALDANILKLGLFPRFKAGAYDHMASPRFKHDYLFKNDTYRLREGQSRRWQVWVDLSGQGRGLARSVDRPLVPAADPAQAVSTGEWGHISAAGGKGMAEYDAWAERMFEEGYSRFIKQQRDYGAMNWGDWWGERFVNWGNNEYDTPLHLLIQFARTGDPKYFYAGETAARHMSEVDVVHSVNPDLKKYFAQWEKPAYRSRPGMVHEHAIGHVGGFYPLKSLRSELAKQNLPPPRVSPFNLGHVWTLGMAHYYLLTGDPWVKQTVSCIGDSLMKLTEDGYLFKGNTHCGRVNGWTMLALAGVQKINPSRRCLKAMRYIANHALEEQDPNCGGWLYEIGGGHCNCVTRHHVGEAGFITAVRLNGLSFYHRLANDARVPDSLLRGVTHLNNDTWKDELSDWRYTSCPASSPINRIGVIMMALTNSVLLTGDREHLRILREAWTAKMNSLLNDPSGRQGLGKKYSIMMYGSPETMSLLASDPGVTRAHSKR